MPITIFIARFLQKYRSYKGIFSPSRVENTFVLLGKELLVARRVLRTFFVATRSASPRVRYLCNLCSLCTSVCLGG